MNLFPFLAQMTANAERIRALVTGIPDEQTRWKPAPDTWSILEVINHLYDEEREDFRVRLEIILHKPTEPFPDIDPERWVSERNYNTRDLSGSLNNFLVEREKTLTWLKGLEKENPDFDVVYTNSYGSISAGDMFAAMVSHDILHLRQLVELHRAWTVQILEPYDGRYAGEW